MSSRGRQAEVAKQIFHETDSQISFSGLKKITYILHYSVSGDGQCFQRAEKPYFGLVKDFLGS